jgi:hypothetical protein
MMTLLLYAETLNPQILESAAPNLTVKSVASRADLARSIVEEPNLLAVVLQLQRGDGDFKDLLLSLRKNFPILQVIILSPQGTGSVSEGIWYVDSSLDRNEIVAQIQKHLSSDISRNRRERPRFDWPLKGTLSPDGTNWQEYRVRSISSSGAFFECEGELPEAGAKRQLRIFFQNFIMRTRCEILDPRHASSNLPFGFGVRFLDFPEESARIIDRIVKDALIQILLNLEARPKSPALSRERLTDRFELF